MSCHSYCVAQILHEFAGPPKAARFAALLFIILHCTELETGATYCFLTRKAAILKCVRALFEMEAKFIVHVALQIGAPPQAIPQ